MVLIKWALNVVPAVRIFRGIATPQWSMFCMRKKKIKYTMGKVTMKIIRRSQWS